MQNDFIEFKFYRYNECISYIKICTQKEEEPQGIGYYNKSGYAIT